MANAFVFGVAAGFQGSRRPGARAYHGFGDFAQVGFSGGGSAEPFAESIYERPGERHEAGILRGGCSGGKGDGFSR